MEREPDRVLELFMAAVSEAGGAGRMVAEHRLDWLPSLMESACTLLLQEDQHRNLEEISDLLGLTRDAVESMLTGPADTATSRICDTPPDDELEREHIAGGVVRHTRAQLSAP